MEKFSLEANGYSRTEVNAFVSEVLKQTEKMLAKVNSQEQQIKDLKEVVAHYKSFEETLKKTIADEERDKVIAEAKNDASRIINDALKQAETIARDKALLERNIKLYKKKLDLILEQQKIIVDKIDEIRIEE